MSLTLNPCSYEWDTTRFPDPAGFVRKLKRQGILNPMYGLIHRYRPQQNFMRKWNPIQPLILSGAVSYLITPCLRHNKSLIIISRKINWIGGVSGYKLDENDGYDYWLWPDVATFPSGNAANKSGNTTTHFYKI